MYITVNYQSTFSVVHRESVDVLQCLGLMKAMKIRLYYTLCEACDSHVVD